jgi:hypothetical protein
VHGVDREVGEGRAGVVRGDGRVVPLRDGAREDPATVFASRFSESTPGTLKMIAMGEM